MRKRTIIAECGHNHNGDMKLMKKMIRTAKNCGADVVKTQLYDVAKILKPDFEWYWDLKRSQLSKDDWLTFVDECNRLGIDFIASVFDVERVKWCEEVGMKCYKIASRSIYDTELLEAVCKTGKDILISLGNADDRGIPRVTNGVSVGYLYCVADYPARFQDLILDMVNFDKYIGLSDHGIGIEAAVFAMARGARIIEKHFTLNKMMEGCDHSGSMEPAELSQLVHYARTFEAIG